ncbi:lytic transglycosylase F [Vibrio sp. UCD-FRSSP16_10]|uniref:transglycosylase SLT domain-containing protein n=1 Tax=unclassified Vibrio TaxID=2614977 RepID=UPI00080030EF|nr:MULTISPECIES: lytic transglycosylase F [unclassified Vibrio]OBT07276.1 lytic transglycosylase F [Vibrio sp. UCD-FRSSP16_30]OBT12756.1 lytic transglycosylase F [Vibrio sp. UCD-FRSSP16_10]
MKNLIIGLFALVIISLPIQALELSPIQQATYTGDYKVIKEKGVVRALVAADLGFYYVEGGRPKGIIAEQLHHFELSLKKKHPYMRVKIIPVTRDELFDTLNKGYGDIAIANLTITERRKKIIDFSTPILNDVNELILTHKQSPKITSLEQTSGMEVWVRASSSYFESIQLINEQLSSNGLNPIAVNFVQENLQDIELVEMVNQGIIPATIIDSHKAKLWLNVMNNIQIHEEFPVRTNGKIAWALRHNNPEFKKVINNYIRTAKRGTLLGNVIYGKYLQDTRWLTRALNPKKMAKLESLSKLFERYGQEYEIDWVMLSAQAFQESGLDNSKVSHRGAVGIMQVLPATAKDPYINIPNIKPVENNIHAGTKYLRFIHDRYFSDSDINDNDKVYFSLASYNAGPAKIRRMRALAKKQGFDHNVWFNNVEIVARRNIGREPVQYVANINRYYTIYKQLGEIQDERRKIHDDLNNQIDPVRLIFDVTD